MTTPHEAARPSRPLTRRDFGIAIICALTLESDAVKALFDVHWDHDGSPYDKAEGDTNTYSTGAIGRHNVVLAHMPGMGKANASAVAANCRTSFPNIKLALVVGVCGVVPFSSDGTEIVLGDIIVSDGVIQYDLGRRLPDRFVRKDTLLESLGRPNAEIMGLLAKLKGIQQRRQLISNTTSYLDTLRKKEPLLQAEYPGAANDRLFEATYHHTENQQSCEQLGCNGRLVPRRRLETSQGSPQPTVHFGLVASGDSVMKSGEDRDVIAKAEGVIAFEMEGTGVWDSFPCVVIKGACDYADSHKSKGWQRYAAATAAACAKAFLSHWVPSAMQVGDLGITMRHQIHSIPFLRNQHFVGREETIDALKRMLFTDNSNEQVALVGLGGMGKTQVALHLAHWVKDSKPHYSVFWLPAFSMAGFEQECGKLVKKLGIQRTEQEDAKEVIRQHLSSEDAGNWFLIVDNADDMELLHGSTHPTGGILDFLPCSNNGRILFTTRSKKVAVTAARNAVVQLPQMHPKEATELLETSLIDRNELHNGETVAELVRTLTYLPLAITQAAAYMNTYETSVAEYLRLFESTDKDKIELLKEGFRDHTHYNDSQGAVATTWIISFEQILQSSPSAAKLLSFIAFIEPKAISRSILPSLETEQQMTQAIGTLIGHGFLNRRQHDSLFDMHSLVHLATGLWNKEQGRAKEMQQTTLSRLAQVFPHAEWENRDLWRQYFPHALKVLGAAGSVESKKLCRLGELVSRCLLEDGRFKEAVKLLEHVVAIWKEVSAEDHPGRLASQHTLAIAYRNNGQIKEAVELLEYVVAIRNEVLAEDHQGRLASQHQLAIAYRLNGQIKEAVELLEYVVAIRNEVSAEDHPGRLASQHTLAITYRANGQIKEAVELLEHVVAIQKEVLAEDHPDQLVSQQVLAVTYHANGQVEAAIGLLEYVVQINARIYSESHPVRLASEKLLASFLGS